MIGSFVLHDQNPGIQRSETPHVQSGFGSSQRMDPLSEALALLKPQSLSSGGFMVPGDMAIYFPKHQGIKCYAMLAGQCWLVVEGVPQPVRLEAGDCFVLPRGLPFQLTTDLSLEPVHYTLAWGRLASEDAVFVNGVILPVDGGLSASNGQPNFLSLLGQS